MIINQKTNGRASSIPAGLAMGGAVSMAITVAAVGIFSWMLNSEKMAWENVGYGILAVLMVASFLGASTAYGKVKSQRLLICLLAGVVYLGCLLSITALFFGGQYDGAVVTAGAVLGGSLCAGLLGAQKKSGRNSGRGRNKRRKIGTVK